MPGEVTIAVRVKPGAARTRVGGCCQGGHGAALVVAVTAPAVDGRASEAARRALAGALSVRPGSVRLHRGATSRDKRFTVSRTGVAGGRRRAEADPRTRTLRDQSPS